MGARKSTSAGTIRCKFHCVSVLAVAGLVTATLEPRYDKDNPDDQPFATATPVGKVEIGITRHEMMGAFEPGEDYYFDITPVPDKPKAEEKKDTTTTPPPAETTPSA